MENGSRRRGLGLVLLAALAIAATVPAADGSQWALSQLPGKPTLYGMSCPSPSLCVTVGSNNSVASSTDPTGGAGDWQLVYPGAGSQEEPGGEGSYNGSQVRGIACPSAGLCVASSLDGFLYSSSNPTGPASAWNVADVSPKGPNTHMYGISCPSPSLCVAVAFGGKIVTSTHPTGGGAAWATAQLAEPLQLSGVSCPSPSLCVAVSRDGAIVSSTDPTGGAGAWQVSTRPEFGRLFGIACPSPSLCLTGNATDFISSGQPTAGADAWSFASGASPLQIMALSCPSATACAAVDNNADAFTSLAPSAGSGAWSFLNVLPYTAANGAFGISCPTLTFCAVAAAEGQVVTSTDPFGDGPTPAKLAPGKHHRRPTVRLTHHPPRRLRIHGRRVRVRFRFREIGQPRGFLCKLDRKRFRHCHSPRAYRVGLGWHAFRVKVFDPGGFDQTVTRFRFRVIRARR
jgi:hypothetical protein